MLLCSIADLDLQLVAKDQELETELAAATRNPVQAVTSWRGEELVETDKITAPIKNALPSNRPLRASTRQR